MALRTCRTFSILTPDAAGAYLRAKRAIEDGEGMILGTVDGGKFEGRSPLGFIRGTYTRTATGFDIKIDHKPMLALCPMIEDRVKEFFVG